MNTWMGFMSGMVETRAALWSTVLVVVLDGEPPPPTFIGTGRDNGEFGPRIYKEEKKILSITFLQFHYYRFRPKVKKEKSSPYGVVISQSYCLK